MKYERPPCIVMAVIGGIIVLVIVASQVVPHLFGM